MRINLWITKRCNLSCSYCYEGIEKEECSMNQKIINDTITFLLKKDSPLSIRFHGGEPLLEFKLIRYFIEEIERQNYNKVPIDYHMTTNGLMATEEILKYLQKYMQDISLSIDGNRKVNDENRHFKNGVGSYDILYDKYRLFLKYFPYTRARMTYTTHTVEYLFESVDHIAGLGFQVIAAVPDQFDKTWSFEQSEVLCREIKKISEKYKDKKVRINLIDKSLFKPYGDCSGGDKNISIDADGKIYPCSLSVGNPQFSIGDIWKDIDKECVAKFQSYSRMVNPSCDGCTMLRFCTGNRCKIINKIIHDDFYSPPTAVCLHQNVNVQMYSYMK